MVSICKKERNYGKKVLDRLDQLEVLAQEVLDTAREDPSKSEESYESYEVNSGKAAAFMLASQSFIEKIYRKNHIFYTSFDEYYDENVSYIQMGLDILNTIRQEVEGGWLFALKDLIAAELFIDFLEMAEHLLEQGYKDPAAVIVGSTLENHLRQLYSANSIDTNRKNNRGRLVPKKADQLNSELAKKGVYNRLDLKNVTAWLELRNNAAHGKYNKYSQEQVSLMLSGVMNFMSKQGPF